MSPQALSSNTCRAELIQVSGPHCMKLFLDENRSRNHSHTFILHSVHPIACQQSERQKKAYTCTPRPNSACAIYSLESLMALAVAEKTLREFHDSNPSKKHTHRDDGNWRRCTNADLWKDRENQLMPLTNVCSVTAFIIRTSVQRHAFKNVWRPYNGSRARRW